MFDKINQEKKQDYYNMQKKENRSKTLIKCKHGIEARKLQNAKDERRRRGSKMAPRQNSKIQKGIIQKAIKE